MKIAKLITFNIGLERNNGTGENTPEHVIQTLNQYGLDPSGYRVEVAEHEYGVERTVVAVLPFLGDKEKLKKVVHAVSEVLDQDCIAYAYEHNGELVGELVGPLAEKWGKFNAEYFISF